MNTRMLKIRPMRKFYKWMIMSGRRPLIPISWMSIKDIEHMFEHNHKVDQRNTWCSKNGIGIVSYERSAYAEKLLGYIVKRYRRNHDSLLKM